jgi:hypothetical protein
MGGARGLTRLKNGCDTSKSRFENCGKSVLKEAERMFTVGAFAIIVNTQQHVLLCHRRDMDRWNLPGGGVMHG